MTEPTRAQVIDKVIRFRDTNGCTENEANVRRKVADQLMKKHGIREADLRAAQAARTAAQTGAPTVGTVVVTPEMARAIYTAAKVVEVGSNLYRMYGEAKLKLGIFGILIGFGGTPKKKG